MTTKLSESDLPEILSAIKEVTDPYELGIQLRVTLSKLKAIEKQHPRSIDRQKADVIDNWLRNCSFPTKGTILTVRYSCSWISGSQLNKGHNFDGKVFLQLDFQPALTSNLSQS